MAPHRHARNLQEALRAGTRNGCTYTSMSIGLDEDLQALCSGDLRNEQNLARRPPLLEVAMRFNSLRQGIGSADLRPKSTVAN